MILCLIKPRAGRQSIQLCLLHNVPNYHKADLGMLAEIQNFFCKDNVL